MDGHGVLVEVEAEGGLVVEVRLLLEVELGSVGSVELLGNLLLAVVELLKKVGLEVLLEYRNREFQSPGDLRR